MKTEIIKLNANKIDRDKLRYAADVIKSGGLVAFPTETVYGLGANALDETAVSNIFVAKGRPNDNPLIVHIADKNSLHDLTESIPSDTLLLIDKFWPGPLTLVLKKSSIIPSVITAGLDTVAIRMPSHPVALALIEESGLPIAAPSANTSGKPSPTQAQHVIDDLSGKVDVIIDSGNSKIGVESTVLDITLSPPVILRPGGITPSQLENLLGRISIDPAIMSNLNKNAVPRSPGMKYKHYSPKAEVIIIEGKIDNVIKKVRELVGTYKAKGISVGVLATEQTKEFYPAVKVISMGDRSNPGTIAAHLFQSFREFDNEGVQVILAEAVESTGIGLAIMNRMNKAAGYNIIKAE